MCATVCDGSGYCPGCSTASGYVRRTPRGGGSSAGTTCLQDHDVPVEPARAAVIDVRRSRLVLDRSEPLVAPVLGHPRRPPERPPVRQVVGDAGVDDLEPGAGG